MCHVALGVAEAYWEYRLKPWDMAAGALVNFYYFYYKIGEIGNFISFIFFLVGDLNWQWNHYFDLIFPSKNLTDPEN